jgi:hypothetical protein
MEIKEYSDALQGIGFVIGGTIMATYPSIKKWVYNKKLSSGFNKNLEARSEINKILDEIRIKLGATRVNIMDYHNGKESILGIPFNYVSMFSESCNRLTKPIISEIQQQPIAPIIPILLKLIKSPSGVIFTTDQDKEEQIAIIQQSYGCKSSYTFLLKENIASGTLIISYAETRNPMINPSTIQWIKSQIIIINNLRHKIKKTK